MNKSSLVKVSTDHFLGIKHDFYFFFFLLSWFCCKSQFIESTGAVCCSLFMSPLLLTSLFCLSLSKSVFFMLILDPFGFPQSLF